jgi:hypothetical protein
MANSRERPYGETSSSGRRSRTGKKRQEKDVQKEGAQARSARAMLRAGFLQQYDRDHYRYERQRSVMEEFRVAWFSRFAKRHALRGAAGRCERCQYGAGSWRAQRRRSRQRTGFRPRVGGARSSVFGNRSAIDPRRHADPAQRMPSAEAAQSVSVVDGRLSVARANGI